MILTDESIVDKLSKNSHLYIHFKCDYCKCEFHREFRRCYKLKYNDSKKDYCKKCIKLNNLENFLIKLSSKSTEYILNYLMVNDKQKISGIYSITNIKNNKVYIGSSKDIIDRWKSHISEINANSHYCKDFNDLEICDLDFCLIEIVEDTSELLNREYYYIKLIENKDLLYNVMQNTGNKKYEKVNKEKLDLSARLKRSKFTLFEIMEIKKLLCEEKNIEKIVKMYNSSTETISSIKRGKTWGDVSPELNELMLKVKNENRHKGEANGGSKLKRSQVVEIKKLLQENKCTLTSIAEMYSVSRTLISYIKKGKLWSDI